MEVRPILSTLLRNRLGAILVASQVAITMAVLCNASYLAIDRLQKINRPTGVDIDNTFSLDVINFDDGFSYKTDVEIDLAVIRGIDGVIAATSTNAVPLSGSGWGLGLSTHLDEAAEEGARVGHGNIYMMDQQGIDALGLRLVAGRNFSDAEIHWREYRRSGMPHVVIVTQAMADILFPNGDALGQVVYSGNDSMEIIGIVERLFGSWVAWDDVGNSFIVPAREISDRERFIVRTEVGQRDAVMPLVERALAERQLQRVVENVIAIEDFRFFSYAADRTAAIVLLVIVCLLVTTTALGIVGLVSFLVAQRTKQMGTRRALGAQRWQVVRYFLVENWLITTVGLSLGLIMTSALNYYLVQNFELPRMPLGYLPLGLISVWVLSFLASLGPARRAAMVAPAIATRTV